MTNKVLVSGQYCLGQAKIRYDICDTYQSRIVFQTYTWERQFSILRIYHSG